MGSVWSYIVGDEDEEQEAQVAQEPEVKYYSGAVEEGVKPNPEVKYYTEPPPVFEPDTFKNADGKSTFVLNIKKMKEDTNRFVEWYKKEAEKEKESYIKKYNVPN